MSDFAFALLGSLFVAWCVGFGFGLAVRLVRWIHDVI